MAERQQKNPIRVVVVDDHPMLRHGTVAYLEQARDVEIVGAASDGVGAIALVTQCLPDILVLDVQLPDLSGVEVAGIVRARFPQVGIVILTGYDDPGHFRALLQLGVEGYLQKTVSGEEIIATVRAVAAGQRTPKSIVRTRTLLEASWEVLSVREREIMQLLEAGLRNSEIAKTLTISPKTVEYHVTHLLAKLGVRSRTEAVLKNRQRDVTARYTSNRQSS